MLDRSDRLRGRGRRATPCPSRARAGKATRFPVVTGHSGTYGSEGPSWPYKWPYIGPRVPVSVRCARGVQYGHAGPAAGQMA
jgi:hypothetical protein